MKIRAIDLETTGFKTDDKPTQGIMEIGYADLVDGEVSAAQGQLVDSGISTSIEARAVHHISDDMCAGEIRPDDACKILMDGDHEYFCAHNTDHEKQFFGGGERKWLCTYKTALRLWPDAPGHKLNELRYFLELDENNDFDQKQVLAPHRAPSDAYICAHLIRRILQEAELQSIDIDRLVKWSSGPGLLYMCWMKAHKGKPWHEVPASYLDWIVNKSDVTDRDIKATARYYLKKHQQKGS